MEEIIHAIHRHLPLPSQAWAMERQLLYILREIRLGFYHGEKEASPLLQFLYHERCVVFYKISGDYFSHEAENYKLSWRGEKLFQFLCQKHKGEENGTKRTA